jgi:hypothetical protein
MAKIYLQVAFADKAEAKAAGAKWDASERSWYWLQSSTDMPSSLLKFLSPREQKFKSDIDQLFVKAKVEYSAHVSKALDLYMREMAGLVRAGMDKNESKKSLESLYAQFKFVQTIPEKKVVALAFKALQANVFYRKTLLEQCELLGFECQRTEYFLRSALLEMRAKFTRNRDAEIRRLASSTFAESRANQEKAMV